MAIKRAKAKPRTIDDYLAAVRDDQRAALEKLRKTIRSVVPRAEECISEWDILRRETLAPTL